MFRVLPLFMSALVALVSAENSVPIVATKDGMLRGTYMESKKGTTFSAFMGIPYAKPPTGDLRFKTVRTRDFPFLRMCQATPTKHIDLLNSKELRDVLIWICCNEIKEPPVPIGSWKGILDASTEHAVCPQRNIFTRTDLIEGDEDCLYLNIYTPKKMFDDKDLLAVMVFFHGGGYVCGGGNITWYAPHILMDKDVILVVPNYRLGPLGFLSTGDDVCPGNNGLKDQSMALRWVNKNIYQFGGDPNKITIFGESAGGASVHLHMASPLSKGLFSGVISQSGTALTTWTLAPKEEGLESAKKLATFLNCPTYTTKAIIECLRKIDAYELIEQDRKFMDWDFEPMIPFKPVIEPQGENSYLTEHPIDIIKSGNVMDVPWITGVNTDEGALKAAGLYGTPHLIEELNQKFEKVVPISLFYEKTATDPDEITKQIRDFYFGKRKIDNSTRQQVIDMYSDAFFMYAADSAVRLHKKYLKNDVYYYLFGYRGEMSMSERFGDKVNDYGVCHGDELQYIFDFGELTSKDKIISDMLVDLWTNFAKNRNPTPEGSIYKWDPVASDKLEYAYFSRNGTIKMEEGLYNERNKFWSTLHLGLKQDIIRDEL